MKHQQNLAAKPKLPQILNEIISKCTDKNGRCELCSHSEPGSDHQLFSHINPFFLKGILQQKLHRSARNKKAEFRKKCSNQIKNKYVLEAGMKRNILKKWSNGSVLVCFSCNFGTNRLADLKQHLKFGHQVGSSSSEHSSKESSVSADEYSARRRFSHVQMIPLVDFSDLTSGQESQLIRDEPMSLLENSKNPESFELPDYGKMVSENLKNFTYPKPSSPNLEQSEYIRGKTEKFYDAPSSLDSELFFWDIPAHLRSNNVTGLRRNNTGFFCPHCYSVFTNYASYDEHLLLDSHSEILPRPVPVGLRTESNLPVNIGVRYRFPKFVLNSANSWRYRCTSCGRREFESTAEFHEHLILCGYEVHSRILMESEFDTSFSSNENEDRNLLAVTPEKSENSFLLSDSQSTLGNDSVEHIEDEEEIEF